MGCWGGACIGRKRGGVGGEGGIVGGMAGW